MGMDKGGGVPDTGDAPIDADQGQEGQAGDQGQEGQAGDQTSQQNQSGPSPAVQSALTAARSQFGLNDNMFNMMSKQTAGNMPTKPAGPGGDQPTSNPFPTKNPATPFGTKTSQADSDGDSDTVSAAGGGAIPEMSDEQWNSLDRRPSTPTGGKTMTDAEWNAVAPPPSPNKGYDSMRPSTNIEDHRVVPGTDLKKLLPNQ
jgi:hypothetical protein